MTAEPTLSKKDKDRIYYTEYRKNNRQKIRERGLKWYHENKKKCRESAKRRRKTPEGREKDKLYARKYRAENRERILEYRRGYYKENAEKERNRSYEYRKNNREKYLESTRKTHQKNRKKESEYSREYTKKRRDADPSYRIVGNLRSKIRLAMKAEKTDKKDRFNKLLGCSPSELVKHLELLFKEGMSWENYGLKGWHIDHIKPCASFDLTNIEEQNKCFNYKNLQPLWAKDNLSKGANVIWPLQ